VDRDGKIRAQYAGDDPFLNEDRQEANIRQKIEQLLTEGVALPQKSALTRKK
jgi:hypothetical protein